MSSSVSQIKFWLEGSDWNNSVGSNGLGGTYLSYDVFLGLSVLGGYFALDHLYLRSPLTFLAKFIVNLYCYGIWWLYDALQAVFNTDVVKVYGLGVPVLGPKGIAAGVLASPEPGKKHLRFLIYSLCLFFGGLFGLDSFLTGKSSTGIIRLLLTVSVILMPIAMIWWAYKAFQFFADTEGVINENAAYFGAIGGYGISSFFSPTSVLGKLINPIVGAIDSLTKSVEKLLDLGTSAVDLAKTGIEKGSQIAEDLKDTVSAVGTAMSGTSVPSLYQVDPSKLSDAATKAQDTPKGTPQGTVAQRPSNTMDEERKQGNEQKQGNKEKQDGGNLLWKGGALLFASDLNTVSYVLIGTLVFIFVAGLSFTYYRAKKNAERPQQDDSPPEPGVLRTTDPEKPIKPT